MGIVTTSCARGFYPEEPLLWFVSSASLGPFFLTVNLTGNSMIYFTLSKRMKGQRPELPCSSEVLHSSYPHFLPLYVWSGLGIYEIDGTHRS